MFKINLYHYISIIYTLYSQFHAQHHLIKHTFVSLIYRITTVAVHLKQRPVSHRAATTTHRSDRPSAVAKRSASRPSPQRTPLQGSSRLPSFHTWNTFSGFVFTVPVDARSTPVRSSRTTTQPVNDPEVENVPTGEQKHLRRTKVTWSWVIR